jgi:hypothetical protein
VSFTPTAGPVAIIKIGTATIPGINWTLGIDPKIKDVSNFRDGRITAATLQDADLSFTVVWDQDAEPTATSGPNLRDGAVITAQLYTSSSAYFSVTAQVSHVEPALSGMEDVLMYSVQAKLNGSVTYPT